MTTTRKSKSPPVQGRDKQLQCVSVEAVMEKRRLDQALNAKEFAVCAGVSYSTARQWFRLPGFPVFRGVVFWQDFVRWRTEENGFISPSDVSHMSDVSTVNSSLPSRAIQILRNV